MFNNAQELYINRDSTFYQDNSRKINKILKNIDLKAEIEDFKEITSYMEGKYTRGGCYDFALALHFLYRYKMLMLNEGDHAITYDTQGRIYDIAGQQNFQKIKDTWLYSHNILYKVDVPTMVNRSIGRWSREGLKVNNLTQRVNEAISLIRNNSELFGGIEL